MPRGEMPRNKEFESDVWCPKCHAPIGEIYRVQVNADVWTYETKPSTLPKWCHACEKPVERRVA